MGLTPRHAGRRGASTGAGRDDRIYPVTRWVARGIIPFLAAACLVLWVVPDRTTALFAWTIRPEMTPVVMGAGYGAGVYFFYRVANGTEWHRVAPVFLGITTFTWAMALATVLHWGQFNHSHYTFVLWVVLYAVTPVIVPGVWAFNRRTDPGRAAMDGPSLPRVVRLCGGVLGLVVTVSAVVLFAVPDLMIGAWPWTVSPLTARILAGWFVLFGVVNGAVVRDGRWSAARVLVQSQVVGFALVLVGVVRFWGNFDGSNTLTWPVVGGMALYLALVSTLYVRMERR
jgi:hypothetical protein